MEAELADEALVQYDKEIETDSAHEYGRPVLSCARVPVMASSSIVAASLQHWPHWPRYWRVSCALCVPLVLACFMIY